MDVVVDRLARVEVKHGAAPASGTTRTYNSIAARYEFTYGPGRFGKSLLKEIIQGVDDPHVHEIEYYDDLTGTTTVDGFATGVDLDTAPGSGEEGDVGDITFLDTTADVSALGGGETNAGSGNLYIGFNPISPSKTFSFGVGLELSGGDTEAIAEWIDLNGDNLPDKVFLDGSNVKFRLNTTGAAGAGDAGNWPLKDVSGINGLSKNSNFSFQVSAEAYPAVALGLGTGLGFSWSNTYFTDVNGDGLVDFVTGGTVHFNTLNADGIPTFSTSERRHADPARPIASAQPEQRRTRRDQRDAGSAVTPDRYRAEVHRPVHGHDLDRRERRPRQRGRDQRRRRPRRHPAQTTPRSTRRCSIPTARRARSALRSRAR